MENWKYLHTAQNEALHITTGCLKMSHTDRLHVEKKCCWLNAIKNFLLNRKQYWLVAILLPITTSMSSSHCHSAYPN